MAGGGCVSTDTFARLVPRAWDGRILAGPFESPPSSRETALVEERRKFLIDAKNVASVQVARAFDACPPAFDAREADRGTMACYVFAVERYGSDLLWGL